MLIGCYDQLRLSTADADAADDEVTPLLTREFP